MIVGGSAFRGMPVAILNQLGYQTAEADDAYAAMAELCRRPLAYRALILSLSSLYREELQIIATVKQRFAHVELWLSHTEGRALALAEASRLGADGLLADDGVHRFAVAGAEQETTTLPEPQVRVIPEPAAEEPKAEPPAIDAPISEPVLTADELRALLQEQPVAPENEGGS